MIFVGRGPGRAGIFDFSRDIQGAEKQGLQPLKSYQVLSTANQNNF
jgi:hypothetical protein